MRFFLLILFFLFNLSIYSKVNAIKVFIDVDRYSIKIESLIELNKFKDLLSNTLEINGDNISSDEKNKILNYFQSSLTSGFIIKSNKNKIKFLNYKSQFIILNSDVNSGYEKDLRSVIPINESFIGITSESIVSNIREMEIIWKWFEGNGNIILEIYNPLKKSFNRYLSPNNSTVFWSLENKEYLEPDFSLPLPLWENTYPYRYISILGIIALIFLLYFLFKKKLKVLTLKFFILALLGVFIILIPFLFKKNKLKKLSINNAEKIVYNSLKNIYHSFNFKKESQIYNNLELSISGDLLEKVYLEVKRSLVSETDGGPQVNIIAIDLKKCIPKLIKKKGFEIISFNSEWISVGEISHWGHVHDRVNRYKAILDFKPINNTWKLIDLELINEERIK